MLKRTIAVVLLSGLGLIVLAGLNGCTAMTTPADTDDDTSVVQEGQRWPDRAALWTGNYAENSPQP